MKTRNEAVDRMVAIMRECNNVALFDDERAELAKHLMKNNVVEVVRCENCKFCRMTECPITGLELNECVYWCGGIAVKRDHYCGYGLRKGTDNA